MPQEFNSILVKKAGVNSLLRSLPQHHECIWSTNFIPLPFRRNCVNKVFRFGFTCQTTANFQLEDV